MPDIALLHPHNSPTPNFPNRRRRTHPKKNNRFTEQLASKNRYSPPDPDMLSKQMKKKEFFAGSAFVESPPASSVPIPAFFSKSFAPIDPTTELRRILGLSLC